MNTKKYIPGVTKEPCIPLYSPQCHPLVKENPKFHGVFNQEVKKLDSVTKLDSKLILSSVEVFNQVVSILV